MKRFCIIVLAILALLVFLFIFHAHQTTDDLERKIMASVDAVLEGGGECEIDLAMLATEFEWDTVSIFVAGNSAQIRSHLKVDNDIFDGIVFSLAGQPVKVIMSTYQFPQDLPPRIGYSVKRSNAEDPYFVSFPFEHAKIQARKYISSDGSYRYLLYTGISAADKE